MGVLSHGLFWFFCKILPSFLPSFSHSFLSLSIFLSVVVLGSIFFQALSGYARCWIIVLAWKSMQIHVFLQHFIQFSMIRKFFETSRPSRDCDCHRWSFSLTQSFSLTPNPQLTTVTDEVSRWLPKFLFGGGRMLMSYDDVIWWYHMIMSYFSRIQLEWWVPL